MPHVPVNSRVPVHIVFDITYNISEPAKSVIKTNAKPKTVRDLLADWLIDQMGRGKDSAPADNRSEYRIKIGLNLDNDNFYTESDTGNESLACGLIISLFLCLDRLTILPLHDLSTEAANV